jgi:hypothetical protein
VPSQSGITNGTRQLHTICTHELCPKLLTKRERQRDDGICTTDTVRRRKANYERCERRMIENNVPVLCAVGAAVSNLLERTT